MICTTLWRLEVGYNKAAPIAADCRWRLGRGDAEAAVVAAEQGVIATPAAAFRGGNIVVDCWRVLPVEVGEVADLAYWGRGT